MYLADIFSADMALPSVVLKILETKIQISIEKKKGTAYLGPLNYYHKFTFSLTTIQFIDSILNFFFLFWKQHSPSHNAKTFGCTHQLQFDKY